MHEALNISGTVYSVLKYRRKSPHMEGFQLDYGFQSLLRGVPSIFQTLLPFPNFIVTKQTLSAEILRRKVPVHDVPERFDELRTRIAIVDVIRVFPNVQRQERLGIGGQRRSGVAGRHDVERTVSL